MFEISESQRIAASQPRIAGAVLVIEPRVLSPRGVLHAFRQRDIFHIVSAAFGRELPLSAFKDLVALTAVVSGFPLHFLHLDM